MDSQPSIYIQKLIDSTNPEQDDNRIFMIKKHQLNPELELAVVVHLLGDDLLLEI